MFYPMMVGSAISSGYASIEATAAQNTAREAQTKTELISHDIERLLLVTEAMWTMMKQQHGYTDDALIKMIEEIDSRKTIVGGVTVKSSPQTCPNCGRPNSASRLCCIYCGKPLEGNPFAR